MQQLINMFVGNLPKRVSTIREAQESGDLAEVQNLAHQMLGCAEGYGFPQLGQVASKQASSKH